MQSAYGDYSPGFLPMNDHNDGYLDDWTTRLALSQASRRQSRGSQGHRTGSAMRIVKPSSANNSPRASTSAGRRRTTVNDSPMCRRHAQPLGRSPPSHASDMAPAAPRSSRPMSWHPSSHFFNPQPQLAEQPQHQRPGYPLLTPNQYADQDLYQSFPYLSPMMASYSTNTSPTSAFSPLPLGYQPVSVPQYLSPDAWDASQRNGPCFPSAQATHPYATERSHYPEAVPCLDTPAVDSSNWKGYMGHGLGNTTPPTPESFINAQQVQPAVTDEAIPPESLDDAEEEGEILVGMGLYDDKYDEDPQLNNYRSSASLFGSSFRPLEPTGKGLKLEETWEPPQSDDEDDEDAEDDDDSESSI